MRYKVKKDGWWKGKIGEYLRTLNGRVLLRFPDNPFTFGFNPEDLEGIDEE